MSIKLKVGDKAPDFELKDAKGKVHRLSDYRGKYVVVYFYPKNNTSVCTAEACSFRDQYEDFKQKGVEVIGISGDSANSHESFSAKYNLPFVLLSDSDNSARKAFGALQFFGVIPSRITYVIDGDGIIRLVFDGLFKAEEHVERALQLIQEK
jgi:peroxiredoxin Q/BCP